MWVRERTVRIGLPSFCLPALTGKAATGSFSLGFMIMALVQAQNSRAVQEVA